MPQTPSIRVFALAALLATSAACAAASGGLSGDSANGNGANGDSPNGDSANGDAANGRELFVANGCPACHGVTSEDNSMVGPSLFGVVGRKAGTAPSLLGASENLKEYGVTWNADTLNEFLADPNAKVPGTPMSGVLADPGQRADVIAYLSTLQE